MVRVVLGEIQQDLELIREVGHSATSYDLLEVGGAPAKVGVIHIIESFGVISVDCDQISKGELHSFVFMICDFLTIGDGADRNATVVVTCGYESAGAVRRLLRPPEVSLLEESFGDQCLFRLAVDFSRLPILTRALEEKKLAFRLEPPD